MRCVHAVKLFHSHNAGSIRVPCVAVRSTGFCAITGRFDPTNPWFIFFLKLHCHTDVTTEFLDADATATLRKVWNSFFCTVIVFITKVVRLAWPPKVKTSVSQPALYKYHMDDFPRRALPFGVFFIRMGPHRTMQNSVCDNVVFFLFIAIARWCHL